MKYGLDSVANKWRNDRDSISFQRSIVRRIRTGLLLVTSSTIGSTICIYIWCISIIAEHLVQDSVLHKIFTNGMSWRFLPSSRPFWLHEYSVCTTLMRIIFSLGRSRRWCRRPGEMRARALQQNASQCIFLPPVIFRNNVQYCTEYVVAICNSFTHIMRWRPKDRKNSGHFARRNLDCVGLSATFFFLTPVESPSSQFCPVVVRPARPSALGNFPTFTIQVEPVRARKPSRCFLEGFEWHFGSVVAADRVLLRQYILQDNVYCFSLGFENSDCTVILCNALHCI